jgi:hypothetical protein
MPGSIKSQELRFTVTVTECVRVCVCVLLGRQKMIKYKQGGKKKTRRTDEHAVAHKSAHLATGIGREPLAQDELQLVRLLAFPPRIACTTTTIFTTTIMPFRIVAIAASVVAVVAVLNVYATFKDRVGTKVVQDKVGRLQ